MPNLEPTHFNCCHAPKDMGHSFTCPNSPENQPPGDDEGGEPDQQQCNDCRGNLTKEDCAQFCENIGPNDQHARELDATWHRPQRSSTLSAMFPVDSYLARFFAEKEVPSKIFEIEDKEGTLHMIPSDCVIEVIAQVGKDEREKIEAVLRRIDFGHGDVNHFLLHLAKALVAKHGDNWSVA